MKLCFYSPYLTNEHMGGGEKHLFDTARIAAKHHQVFIAVTPLNTSLDTTWLLNLKQKYEKFFGFDLSKVEFIFSPINSSTHFINKLLWTGTFDGLYYVTDGSLFFSIAKKNYVHFQIPLKPHSHSALERLKVRNWQKKNANSEFTKHFIEKVWNTNVQTVHYPLVSLDEFSTKPLKKNIILHVGRFFRQLHSKRQDVLVEMFRELIKRKSLRALNLELHFVGAIEDHDYYNKIVTMAKNLPVRFHTTSNRQDLLKLYNAAKVYWHATGYEVDQHIHPEKVEHFGISTIEAMAAGAVPVVHAKGGQIEVLSSTTPDLLWKTTITALDMTEKLLISETMYKKYQILAKRRAQDFGMNNFETRTERLFGT